MKSIRIMISSFSEQEIKDFYEFVEKKGRDKESLPLKLFEIYKKDTLKTEEEIVKELKIKEINYFYQIRYRLKKLLENFILETSVQNERNYFIEVSNYINIAYFLRNKNLHEKALGILEKAEKICEQNSDFELLSLVYSHMLSIAQVYPEIEAREIIKKQSITKKKAEIFNQLEIDYAVFKRELYKSNYSLPQDEIIKKLDHYLTKFHLYDLTKLDNFNLQYKVLTIIMDVILYTENTYELFQQYEQKFIEWDKQLLFNKKNIEKKLSLTYRMCVYLLKQFRFDECNTHLERFYQDLQLPETETLRHHYTLLYYQVKTTHYAYTGRISNAIYATLDLLEKNLISNRIDIHFIFLFNLAIFYFTYGKYEDALSLFLKLEKRKNFSRYLTESVKLDINIYKTMIMILLKRRENAFLKNIVPGSTELKISKRKQDFIQILIYIARNKDWQSNEEFLESIQSFLKTKTRISVGEEEHICFNSFLRSLIEQTSYAEEFFKLISSEIKLRTGKEVSITLK